MFFSKTGWFYPSAFCFDTVFKMNDCHTVCVMNHIFSLMLIIPGICSVYLSPFKYDLCPVIIPLLTIRKNPLHNERTVFFVHDDGKTIICINFNNSDDSHSNYSSKKYSQYFSTHDFLPEMVI